MLFALSFVKRLFPFRIFETRWRTLNRLYYILHCYMTYIRSVVWLVPLFLQLSESSNRWQKPPPYIQEEIESYADPF